MEKKDIAQTDIKSVHSLLFGDNNELITDTVKKEARGIVSDVISEAIHDRQRKDQSLSKTIAPMMETAIAQSIENNKANLVSSLYPIVGSLVRKSVSVFFNSFLEKLNYLIEYSLTVKGLKWRFAAWRLGIPFTQYVIKRSFVYRVENVMLIHQPTGTLLLDVASEHSECNDPELMSAMLTAINDFITDSFANQQEHSLDTIKTQDLTLSIASSPHALLVAAVSGTPPADLQKLLQQTLEEVHQLLCKELQNYQGNNAEFVNAETNLRSCLISELNTSEQQKKKPLWGIISLIFLLVFLLFQFVSYWQKQQLLNLVNDIPPLPGFHLQEASWHNDKLVINILRDPTAITLKQWQTDNQLPAEKMQINQVAYASLEPSIVKDKITQLTSAYPLEFKLNQGLVTLFGELETPLSPNFYYQLLAIPGVNKVDSEQVTSSRSSALLNYQQQQLVLDRQIGELSAVSIDFESKSSKLTTRMETEVLNVAKRISLISQLAKNLDITVGIIILGYSDSLGNTIQNQALSKQRALQVKSALINHKVSENILYSVGIGEVPLDELKSATRKVMFSTIVLAPQNDQKESL